MIHIIFPLSDDSLYNPRVRNVQKICLWFAIFNLSAFFPDAKQEKKTIQGKSWGALPMRRVSKIRRGHIWLNQFSTSTTAVINFRTEEIWVKQRNRNALIFYRVRKLVQRAGMVTEHSLMKNDLHFMYKSRRES